MNKLFTTLAIILFSGTIAMAQTPCTDGFVSYNGTNYPCVGYDLMSLTTASQIDVEGGISDCWGWTDPQTGIEYGIIGASERTVFVDISDPVNPVYMGYLLSATGSTIWRDIKVYNDHAFIVSEASGHGMQVFDLTRLRDDFIPPMEFEADAYYDDFGHCHNIAINEDSGYAYPVGTSSFDGGPHFINIQDPVNPVFEGSYDGDGYTHDAQIIIYDGPDVEHQCKEIFFGFNADALTIVDVTDKTDPTQLSRTEYEQTGYTHQGWLSEDRTTMYMNDETDETGFGFNTRTLVMDVTDLDNPVLTHEFFGPTTATDHNLYVLGDKIYQANYRAGLRVLQITDVPETPLEEVGYFDLFPNSNDAGTSGLWSNYPYFESGNILISGGGRYAVVSSTSIVPNDVDPDLVDCSTGIEELDKINFSLFPNPTNSTLNISPTNEEIIESILITDLVGKQVFAESKLNLKANHQIDVSNLSPGTYFLSVNAQNRALKFVVE